MRAFGLGEVSFSEGSGYIVFIPCVRKFFRAYVEVCAATLARAHARSSDPSLISGYLGNGDVFDQAIADFAEAYANQAERDYAALLAAIKEGRVQAQTGV